MAMLLFSLLAFAAGLGGGLRLRPSVMPPVHSFLAIPENMEEALYLDSAEEAGPAPIVPPPEIPATDAAWPFVHIEPVLPSKPAGDLPPNAAYGVEIALYAHPWPAENLAARLRKAGVDARLHRLDSSWYVVSAGAYHRLDEAASLRERLNGAGHPASLVLLVEKTAEI
ncbi:SPOR domain-containing protein [Telmatospirillum sp. J64-1]|uniref:SPOR domain-containing protein n=1 Tax=Telmatospirillum sp. J64-1 TaxID=2502183 RepID=UPI00115F4E5E|nr:SPOR domain-containing protein [Telmatospirillum sp. J64-1]